MPLTIVQFRCREDNYGVLLHDEQSGATVSIDAPDAETIRAELDRRGWRLGLILTTHHHGDHTAGNLALKGAYGCEIVGPAREAEKIPGIDRRVDEGSIVQFAGMDVRVLSTPGHTLGHVAYDIPALATAFVGDTLFAMGCGRLFEGTPAMMWNSLEKLSALPGETTLYCGHDYAAANARFALTIDPSNAVLAKRAAEVGKTTGGGSMTFATTVELEHATNPFLRADHAAIRSRLNLSEAPAVEVFAELRRRKDAFT